jgi:hypothetical protein
VTTVTSSDRGDTGSTRSHRGARSSSSDIPGQRGAGTSGGQTLRILVLGTGDAADELRRQAGEAGAELAQRFSARVTHVVVEPGLSGDDPRVAKALAADLPVLTLAECVQLLGFGEADDVEVEPADIPAQPATNRRKRVPAEAQAADSGVDLAGGEVHGVVEEQEVVEEQAVDEVDEVQKVDELQGTVDSTDSLAPDTSDADTDIAADIAAVNTVSDTANEVAEESPSCAVSDAPAPYSAMESMLGSALDAALLFPPMPVSTGEPLTLDAEYLIDSYPTTHDVEDAVESSAQTEQPTASARVKESEDSDGSEDLSELSEIAIADDFDASEAARHSAESADGHDRARIVASYAWAAVPFASLGLLTPVAMGYAAYRQRSRALGAVAAWYLLAVTIAFVLSAASPGGAKAQPVIGDLLTICLAASWIGGTVHATLIRRQVFGPAGQNPSCELLAQPNQLDQDQVQQSE